MGKIIAGTIAFVLMASFFFLSLIEIVKVFTSQGMYVVVHLAMFLVFLGMYLLCAYIVGALMEGASNEHNQV